MKVLVLGIGNILIGDEGAGVFFTHYFKSNLAKNNDIYDELDPTKSHQLVFLDGGTMAMNLAHIIADYNKVYVIDCIDADDLKVGDVVFFDYLSIPTNVNYQGSAHELEMMMTLNFMQMLGDLPECKILAVVPNRLSPMEISLSDELKTSFVSMKNKLLNELKKDGFELEFLDNFSIDDTIDEYKKIGYDNKI